MGGKGNAGSFDTCAARWNGQRVILLSCGAELADVGSNLLSLFGILCWLNF